MLIIKQTMEFNCFELEMIVNFGKIVYWIVTIKMYILENQCENYFHFLVFDIQYFIIYRAAYL